MAAVAAAAVDAVVVVVVVPLSIERHHYLVLQCRPNPDLMVMSLLL